MVENLPANAGDTGSSPGLGRSHMLHGVAKNKKKCQEAQSCDLPRITQQKRNTNEVNQNKNRNRVERLL